MRRSIALVVVALVNAGASASGDLDLADAARFCAAAGDANGGMLDRAEARIDAVKQEIADLAGQVAKRDRVAADFAAAHRRVADQRRDSEELRSQLAHLSPTMIEERRVVGADLRAHLEVLDRLRQIEALLRIELAAIDADIAARRARTDSSVLQTVATSESVLRRCLEDRRRRLK